MKTLLLLLLAAAALLGATVIGSGGATISDLIGYARAAGFAGADLVTAVAVALAESGGDPKAYNPETAAGAPEGKGSYGLWQIYLNAHPEFEGWDLYDPQKNALAAFSVYQAAGNSFHPWSTFKNGIYTAHVNSVFTEVQSLGV